MIDQMMSFRWSRLLAKDLAEERDLTAWHEAGHAVAQVLGELPFYDVRIWLESRGSMWRREKRWSGALRLVPDVELWWIPDERLPEFVVACLAGPEVEARWIHHKAPGVPLADIRAALVDEHEYVGGNFNGLPELLALAGLTRMEAERRTAALVEAWWPQITHVACVLRTSGVMTGGEVAAVVNAAA